MAAIDTGTTDLLADLDESVLTLTLNRPEKRNALDPPTIDALGQTFLDVEADDSVAVLVLSGAGDRAFCAGSDLSSLARYPSTWHFRNRVEYATAVRNVRKPVIAALKGWVLGGGWKPWARHRPSCAAPGHCQATGR